MFIQREIERLMAREFFRHLTSRDRERFWGRLHLDDWQGLGDRAVLLHPEAFLAGHMNHLTPDVTCDWPFHVLSQIRTYKVDVVP